jgi:hypothetical protein
MKFEVNGLRRSLAFLVETIDGVELNLRRNF